MRFEDKYAGTMAGVTEFDFERFIEGSIRNLQPDEDPRSFRYEESILRPRHIIELYEILKKAPADTLFTATAPVVVFDGETLNVKTRAADTFEDLCKYLEDIITTQRFTILYAVQRVAAIDPQTFSPKTVFRIRFVDLS